MLTATETSLPARAAEAIRSYLAQCAELVAWQQANPGRQLSIRRHDDPREMTYPMISVAMVGLKQSWAGGDEFAGACVVLACAYRDTDAAEETPDDGANEHRLANQAAIQHVSAIIERALEDQESLRAYLNADNLSRPVKDFHFYAFTDFDQDINLQSDDGAEWQVAYARQIHIARRDYCD